MSSFFVPLSDTIHLNNTVSVLIRRGYLARNPDKSTYARRAQQIYDAIQNNGGCELEKYINQPTSASGLTLIGPSGIGKTTSLDKVLSLYPQVIFHRKLNTYQIVWLKVNCPHAGSLKGLCTDIFQAIDRLLGTNYHAKFTSRNSTENIMLSQVAQVAHTHHLGLLVIDEIQNLVNARREKEDMLNFLVKMDNIIGVPVIKVGTNQAIPILQGNFHIARRGTGEGSILWDRMRKNDEGWNTFIRFLWKYQWTKYNMELTPEIEEVFYDETQGVIDIVIKLFRMVQCRTIALGDSENISIDLIRDVAADILHLLKPMLTAYRNNDKIEMLKYKDIYPLEFESIITAYEQKCFNELNRKILLQEVKKQNAAIDSTIFRNVAAKLLSLEVPAAMAKELAERAISDRQGNMNVDELVNRAYEFYLVGSTVLSSDTAAKKRRTKKAKLAPSYQERDLRQIVEKAIESNQSAYDAIKAEGLICDPIAEYLN